MFSFFRDPARLLLLFLIPVAAANLAHVALQCGNPQDTSSPESLSVHLALKTALGGPLYSDFRVFPYIVTPYGPLLYEAMGLGARLFSLDPGALFLFGRFLLLACALGTAALLLGRSSNEATARSCAWAAPLLFLSCSILYPWACTCRPDGMAAFLAFAGFLVYIRNEDRPWRFLSIMLFLAAFLAKQSTVAAPLALILWALLNKRKQEGIRAAFLWAATLFLAFLGMHYFTDGLSTMNLFGGNAAPMEARNVRLIGGLFLQAAALPLILAVAGAAVKGWRAVESVYFLVSLAWALFTSAKLGSNVNYFIEPLAASVLLAPAALESLRAEGSRTLRALAGGLFAVLLLPSLNYRINALETLRFDHEKTIRSAVAAMQGPVLTDSPRLALLAREPMLIEPLPLSYLENTGRWSSAPLLKLMNEGLVPHVVLTAPVEQPATWQGLTRLPGSVLKTVKTRYRLQMRLGDYFLYVPKGAPDAP
jgi:uncharacterized membrane protein YozB (DUF420 family)